MSWKVRISKQALEDLDHLRAYHPELYLEAYRMTLSIGEDPDGGAGAPRRAAALGGNVWIRNLSLEDRIVYEVFDESTIIAAYRAHVD